MTPKQAKPMLLHSAIRESAVTSQDILRAVSHLRFAIVSSGLPKQAWSSNTVDWIKLYVETVWDIWDVRFKLYYMELDVPWWKFWKPNWGVRLEWVSANKDWPWCCKAVVTYDNVYMDPDYHWPRR